MSACPHVVTHTSMEVRSKWLVSEMTRVMLHVRTCRHISTHVGMSKCADTCQHADKVQMVGIRDAESDGTCWHMAAHISTCRHISARAKVLTHASMQVRSKWFVSEVPRVMLYFGTYRHMSTHISTCRHISTHVSMSTCAGICQHADKIQIIGIIGTENDVTIRHMSAHVSTCRHVTRCRHMLTDILTVTFSHSSHLANDKYLSA